MSDKQTPKPAPAQPTGPDLAFFQDPADYTLEDFLPILMNLIAPRRHLTSAPTFTPKSLVDSIQLYDDGSNRRLYLYINQTWRYVALT